MQKSKAALLALSAPERLAFVEGLSPNAQAAMPFLFELWAHDGHQLAPDDDWQTWVIMGGRGAGKTRAGAEWVRAQVEGAGPYDEGRCRRVALIGETADEVRAVMVEGESGLLAISPPDRRPLFKISQNKLVWPNGAEARLCSAANPEALRGPQFDCAWSDELAKWRRCREAWEMLQFCLRLGDKPRQIVTTTPRDNRVLLDIMEAKGTVITRAPTWANRAYLADDFVERLQATYGGTALGRQELDGELVREREGALWTRKMIERARLKEVPELDRIVVAVDPPVTGGAQSDECGLMVAGVRTDRDGRERVYVLADGSVRGLGPQQWAERALDLYHEHGADRLVAETNQGGDLVEELIRQIEPTVSYRDVRATRGKRLRAEPVAALYEQGRVHHVGTFRELEDQMCRFVQGRDGGRSPDRLDALVWAVTDLVLDQAGLAAPRVRRV